MIVTCASCLTKFNLEASRIPVRGAKVRCSRCRHIFYVVPPPESHETLPGQAAGFSEAHELVQPIITPEEAKSEEMMPPPLASAGGAEEAEISLPPLERSAPPKAVRREQAEAQAPKPNRAVQGERRTRTAPVIALVVILLLLVIGFFCFWTGYGGTLYSYIALPAKKIADVWHQFWGL